VTYNGTAITSLNGIVASVVNVEHITANLLGGTDLLNYGSTSSNVSVDLGAQTASGFSTINDVENVTGGAGADALTGDSLANILSGGGNNDTLTGGGGDDTTLGGAGNDRFVATINDGNDTYNGGAGVDTYDLRLTSAGAVITATSAVGSEIGSDSLSGIENVVGSQGNDNITLNGNSNVIDGQGGDDVIDAGGSNDVIIGGAGNDTMNGGSGNDTFVFAAGFGHDVVIGFDADPRNGGQDFLDISGHGISAATFSGSVSIVDLGVDTLVTIDGHSIMLLGGNGIGANIITQQDFLLA
jgi:Ca2+-binding RTX toxin-like protein